MLMGYAELQQILAEAVVRGWISGNAQTYYEKGIRASFSFYETHAKDYAGYLNENAVAQYLKEPLVDFTQASGTEEQIERIIMQKYLVTFYQGNWDSFTNNYVPATRTSVAQPEQKSPNDGCIRKENMITTVLT